MQEPTVLVFFDDGCGYCQGWAGLLRRLDPAGKTRLVPLSTADLARYHPALTREACMARMHVLTRDGRIAAGWDALALLARCFPLTWPAGVLAIAPGLRGLGQHLYDAFARRRYGPGQACPPRQPSQK